MNEAAEAVQSAEPAQPVGPTPRDATRSRIVEVAARLLQSDGPAAVTTRAVAAAAGVQAPTIYRLFGDKDGLLEAVAEHVMAAHVRAKAEVERAATAAGHDPLDDLRTSWFAQVDFGLANPALFRLLGDPDRVVDSPAAQAGLRVLEGRVHRLAATGRLRVPEPQAVAMVQAAGQGTIQMLLTTSSDQRDALRSGLPAQMLDAVLGRLVGSTDPPTDDESLAAVAPAVALRALAPELHVLSEAERRLLAEWLDRVASGA